MLAHDDVGNGVPIVFIHGFPFDRRMWTEQVRHAANSGLRALAIDLPGFGASSGLVRTIDAYADTVASFLDDKQIARAIVCGLSMGGYIALAMHRRHRAHIAGLVLADTKAGPDTEQAKQGRAANIERARNVGSVAVFDAMSPSLLSSKEHLDELRAIGASQKVETIVAALEAMRDRPDSTPELASITVPTRVVVGSDDSLTPVTESQRIARAIPNATLHVIDGAGHISNVEKSEAFSRAALDGWRI